MADRWLTAKEKLLIYELRHHHGLSYDRIAVVIRDTSLDGHRPNRSTVKRWCDKKPISPLDLPWKWQEMDRWGIPWEASRLLMDCWTLVTHEEAAQPYPRPFTVRLARWCQRVCCALADPDPETKLDIHWLLKFARQFSEAEMAKEVLGEEVDTSALTSYLSILPDESDDRRMAYHRLIDLGVIPPVPFGIDERAELEREKRLHPDDPSVGEALEQLDAVEEAIQAELDQRRADQRAEAERRQPIIRSNHERMGRPNYCTPEMAPELYRGMDHVSPIDIVLGPQMDLYLLDDPVIDEETELC